MAAQPDFDWIGLLRRLNEQHVDFVVIEGVAASLPGSSAVTYDLDVCTSMDELNLSRVLHVLGDLNPRFRFRPDKMPLPTTVDRLRGIKNLNLVTNLGAIDLLGKLPNIGSFDELANKNTSIPIEEFQCRVLDLDTLIDRKRLAARPKALGGLLQLEAIRKMQRSEPGLFDSLDRP